MPRRTRASKYSLNHCAACGHGLSLRDAELGVAGQSMSLGLAAMNDRVAAAGPFAKAAGLLEDLAGHAASSKLPASYLQIDAHPRLRRLMPSGAPVQGCSLRSRSSTTSLTTWSAAAARIMALIPRARVIVLTG